MYNLPHRKGQAEEEHLCAEHIQQLGTKACFCTVGFSCSDRFRYIWEICWQNQRLLLQSIPVLWWWDPGCTSNAREWQRSAHWCMLSVGTLCLYFVSVQNLHKSKWAPLVPLLQSCSWRRKPPANFWFAGLTHSTGTLRIHDLEKGYWKSPMSPRTSWIWLDIWWGFKSLLSCSLFESTSSWSSIAPHKVWVQTWMRRKMQLSQEQYPMYGSLRVLAFQLQQQSYSARDRWGLWRLRRYFLRHSWIQLIQLMSLLKNFYLKDLHLFSMTYCIFVLKWLKQDWTVIRLLHCIWICLLTC